MEIIMFGARLGAAQVIGYSLTPIHTLQRQVGVKFTTCQGLPLEGDIKGMNEIRDICLDRKFWVTYFT